jgi:hypothetical protein
MGHQLLQLTHKQQVRPLLVKPLLYFVCSPGVVMFGFLTAP